MSNLEWSYEINLSKHLNSPLTYRLKANSDVCTLLAKRFFILDVKSFDFDLTVSNSPLHRGFLVEGILNAVVVQECVTTLEPVEEQVNAPVKVLLRSMGNQKRDESEDFEEELEVDYYEDSKFDIAELACQYLALNLNPYPKKTL